MLDYDRCRPEKWNILLALPRQCVHFLTLLLYQSHSGLRYAVFKVKCWCCKSLRRGYAEVPSAFSDAGSIVECHSGCFHFSCWEGLRWWMMSCVFSSLSHFLQLFCFPSIRISHSHTLPHVLILTPVLQHPCVFALIYTKKTFTKLQVRVL